MALLLERAGHRIVAASGGEGSRERVLAYLPATPFVPHVDATTPAEVVLLGVPDDAIADVCSDLARSGAIHGGQRVLHLSGSLGLEALAPARTAGAGVLCLHPLQSFPTVEDGLSRLPGSPIAVTAEEEAEAAFGESLARDVGGEPFRLANAVKPLYHSAAVFCSNYLVAVEALAERLLGLCGVEHPLALLRQLAQSAFDTAMTRGPAEALTGPAARGDVGTISRNLEALAGFAPEAVEPYVALARVASSMAVGSGRLPAEELSRVEEVLDRWR